MYSMGLLGKHINVQSGKWHETLSGIGSNADSFYEYLFKSSVLFREEHLFNRFSDTFISIKKYVQLGNWFSELDLINKKFRKYRFESLQVCMFVYMYVCMHICPYICTSTCKLVTFIAWFLF